MYLACSTTEPIPLQNRSRGFATGDSELAKRRTRAARPETYRLVFTTGVLTRRQDGSPLTAYLKCVSNVDSTRKTYSFVACCCLHLQLTSNEEDCDVQDKFVSMTTVLKTIACLKDCLCV